MLYRSVSKSSGEHSGLVPEVPSPMSIVRYNHDRPAPFHAMRLRSAAPDRTRVQQPAHSGRRPVGGVFIQIVLQDQRGGGSVDPRLFPAGFLTDTGLHQHPAGATR